MYIPNFQTKEVEKARLELAELFYQLKTVVAKVLILGSYFGIFVPLVITKIM